MDFGYYFYLPEKQIIAVSRDAIFLEKEFLEASSIGRKVELDEESSDPNTQQMKLSNSGQLERQSETLMEISEP